MISWFIKIYNKEVSKMLRLEIRDDIYLFFNPNSGAVLLANKKWIHSLPIFELAAFFEMNKMMLLENEIYEFDKKILASDICHKNERGLNVYISPSYQCPMNCIYCFQKDQKNNYDSLEKKNIPDIIESIRRQAENRNIQKIIVVLFGGEPILDRNYDFIKELLEKCMENNIFTRVVSSGTTLNKKFYALFKLYQNIILNFDITVDGVPEIHNFLRPFGKNKSFQIIKHNIDKLLSLGFKVIAKTNAVLLKLVDQCTGRTLC
jgi:sulfatase maturation enzyme AslB (radical SAM superfamily)